MSFETKIGRVVCVYNSFFTDYIGSKLYLVAVVNSQNTHAQRATPLTVHSPVSDPSQRYAFVRISSDLEEI